MRKSLLSLILILFSSVIGYSQRTNISIFTGSGVPTVCFSGTIYIDSLTGNLYTYKIITGCKLAGNVAGISGTGVSGRVSLFNGTNTVTSDSGFTFSGTGNTFDLTLGRDLIAGRQLIGQFGTITPLSDVSSLYLRRFSSTQTSPILLFQTEANAQLSYFDKAGIFNGNVVGNLTGNADTVTNGVYTTGSYADPAWITSLATTKLTGNFVSTFNSRTGAVLPAANDYTFAQLASIPTTIAGYGITDFNSLGDARWSLLAHTHTFASLTSKPTTLSGYGITDAESILTFSSPLARATNTISCPTCALNSGTLSQFASTTSSILRTLLSDETGTGSAVFATSPALVTPALGAATSTSIAIGASGTVILKHISNTATLDFANLAAIGCEDLTITVTGAALGDTVAIGVPNGSMVSNGNFFGWVSATNTVSIRFCTVVSGDPASGTFRADVWQH